MSTSTINIRVTGTDKLSPEILAAVRAGEEMGTEKICIRGVELIVPLTPVAFGVLAGAMQYAQLDSPMHMIIFAGAPADVYAAPVETGTRPHFPPSSALIPWVVQKLGVKNEKQAASIAFAIARAISERGTKGAFMFERTFEQLQNEAPGILELEIATAIRNAGLAGANA